jgi:hypothetical protein
MTVWCSRPHSDSGEPESDDGFLVILKAHSEVVPYLLPYTSPPGRWVRLVDTVSESGLGDGASFDAGSLCSVEPRSCLLFCCHLGRRLLASSLDP